MMIGFPQKGESIKNIEASFSKIREDMIERVKEISELNRRLDRNEREHSLAMGTLQKNFDSLRREIGEIKQTNEELKNMIAESLNEKKTQTKNKNLASMTEVPNPILDTQHVAGMQQMLQQMMQQMLQQNMQIKNLLPTSGFPEIKEENDQLKRELLKKYEKNKREIIKNKIRDIILSKPLTLSELKELIVNQSGYCSKASFYRYYTELKREYHVAEIKEKGRITLTLNTH